jgi:poly(3-hydroxybutyrate) depolymerase
MHRRGIIMLAALAAFAAGAYAQSQTIRFGGVARNFILHAPAGITKPPLVFVLHGSGMSGQQEVDLTKMNAVSDKEKFLVVYPDAINNSWNTSAATDFEFLLAIIDTLDAKYHLDRDRVYASGFSQGGVMAYHIGCRYADKFAAIAPVSGRIQETCTPKRPIPMLAIFGTKDVLTPANFLKDVMIISDFDGCPKTPAVTRPYPAGNASSTVTQLRFGPCKDGIEVWADSVQGGPHEWPMDAKTKMNGSEEVWGFFKKWTLQGSATSARPSPEVRRVRISAAFAAGSVRLQGVETGSRIRIFDHQGRIVSETKAGEGEIPFRGGTSGVYQVVADGKGWSSSALMPAIP